MNRTRVLVFGKSKEKTNLYQRIFALSGYEVTLCHNLGELFEFIQSMSPELIFWSYGIEEISLFKDYLASSVQKREDEGPKLILATSLSDMPLSDSKRVDLIFQEPVLIQHFLTRVAEILKK